MMQELSYTMKDLIQKKAIRLTRAQIFYLFVKRIIDIIISASALVVLSPIFLIIAAAVKVEEPRCPVLYCQNRIGRKGIPFKLYKFRSMRTGAPELSTHEFKNAQSYVTRVGKILRTTSVDELPQLWNVLIGNMSLIGPRPLLPREREVHMLRFIYGLYQVRPGITGLAQTHGRDDMNDYDKVFWDRTYVQHISPLMDFKLLWRTFIKVILHEGVADSTRPNAPESVAAAPDRKPTPESPKFRHSAMTLSK